jgi:hypothetical protein
MHAFLYELRGYMDKGAYNQYEEHKGRQPQWGAHTQHEFMCRGNLRSTRGIRYRTSVCVTSRTKGSYGARFFVGISCKNPNILHSGSWTLTTSLFHLYNFEILIHLIHLVAKLRGGGEQEAKSAVPTVWGIQQASTCISGWW